MLHKINGNLNSEEELIPPDLVVNPFVHRLELSTTYDKIKTGVLTVVVLPFRLLAIIYLLVLAWLLACVGLFGISEEELRTKPLSGWRRGVKNLVKSAMRATFFCAGFHYAKMKGQQATAKQAPILAVAPHSTYADTLPVLAMGAPSVVAKGEAAAWPILGSTERSGSVSTFLVLEENSLYEDHIARRGSLNPREEFVRTKLTPIICALGKGTYEAGGMTITVKGRQATRQEAPILVVAPHSTFLDAGITYVTGFPSIIVRRESGANPFIGKLINYTQPVYVWREDPNSRQNTIKEIIERVNSDLDWPQILIFPEGTCTNRSCLITFKPGAFYPGVPVQPVCIRYPNKLDTVTWTWEGPGALKLLWLTLTQVHSHCEIEFLPVYHPSEEEKKDPKLYANNVRQLMAKALGVPVSDYTYDDCRLMTRAKELNIPCASELVEVQKLRSRLRLNQTKLEEEMLSNNNSDTLLRKDSKISYKEFAEKLEIPSENELLQQLFTIYDKDSSGLIDFREYLLAVLAISKVKNKAQLLETAFRIFDGSGEGKLTLEDVKLALQHTTSIHPESIKKIFQKIDANGKGFITYDEFRQYAHQNLSDFNKVFQNRGKMERKMS